MKFESIVPNPDLAIHPDPPGLWQHVAVACGWKDAATQRDRWPHAAVIGPVRSVRGIDGLARNLLHNPQIRTLIVTGPDGTPGEVTTAALNAFIAGGMDDLGEDVREHWNLGRIEFVQGNQVEVWRAVAADPDMDLVSRPSQPRVKITLPPPPPRAAETAPSGDPGERVVGETLDGLWPRVLRAAMRFGVDIGGPTGTRGVLNLVSVVRDAGKAVADLRAGSTLGLTWAQIEAYRGRLTGSAAIASDLSYTYGARMRGGPDQIDQIEAVERLLRVEPGTRSAYLTPWDPDLDSGVSSGRPCLTGVWFRNRDGLHLTVTFRSHDLYQGWPLNLAGLLLWQVELAGRLGVEAGSLTCLSMDAHVHARDWTEAGKVLDAWAGARSGPDWDQRSAWHVDLVYPPPPPLKPVDPGETLRVMGPTGTQTWRTTADPARAEHVWVVEMDGDIERRKAARAQITLQAWREQRGDFRGPPPEPTIRATAVTRDGSKVLGFFEAETPEALRAKIERSGLVTTIGSALWLGDEIQRVARQGRGRRGGSG